jgi:hypothetical protein
MIAMSSDVGDGMFTKASAVTLRSTWSVLPSRSDGWYPVAVFDAPALLASRLRRTIGGSNTWR